MIKKSQVKNQDKKILHGKIVKATERQNRKSEYEPKKPRSPKLKV